MEAVAKDRVGVTLEDGSNQCRIVAGIVFQVCILDQDQLAARMFQTASDSSPFALVLLVKHEFHGICTVPTQELLQIGFLQEFPGAVGRAIVNNDQLFMQANRLARDLLQESHYRLAFVVDRDNDGERVEFWQGLGLREFGKLFSAR